MAHNGETAPSEEQGGASAEMLEAAVFGREVEDFINNDRIGQYLINRARADLDKAYDALISVDPTQTAQIIKLQLDARVATRVRTWLAEAIQDGRHATVQLQQERDEHGT